MYSETLASYNLSNDTKERLTIVELVHAMICDQLGLRPDELVILGGAIRDLLVGQAPRDWDAYVITSEPEQMARVLTKTVGKLYPWDGNPKPWQPDSRDNSPIALAANAISTGPYDSDRADIHTLGHFNMLGYNVNLCTAPNINTAVAVDWDCCNGYYRGDTGYWSLYTVLNCITTRTIMLNSREALNHVKRTYERGLEFERRYGWKMDKADVQWLRNELIEPEAEVELVRGYRGYKYTPGQGYLTGSQNISWDSPSLMAKCGTHSSMDTDGRDAARHLRRGTCTCGIYAYKGLPDISYLQLGRGNQISVLAQVVMYGYLIELERGYRSQYARIERLFIFSDSTYQDGRNSGQTSKKNLAILSTVATELSTYYGVPVEVMRGPQMYQFTEEGVVVRPSIDEPELYHKLRNY